MRRSRFSDWFIYKYELDAEINEGAIRYYFNNMRGWLYRIVMKTAHKYHWHYAPPIYPNGDTQLHCDWCGFRQTIKHGPKIPRGEMSDLAVNQRIGDAPQIDNS